MAESRPRIFYLDFVRAVATVAIIMTHYNALFIYNVSSPMPWKAFITINVAGIYIGDFGVSLFFIISGASLMYVYDQRFEPKTFYRKRFLGIYPMFWLAYLFAMLYRFFTTGGYFQGVPYRRIIYTILGIDTYVNNFGIRTFSLVGEWFIAVIVMMYMVFPLLRVGVQKHPWITAAVFLGLSLVSTFTWGRSIGLLARIPEFLFGMLFQKYIHRADWKAALVSLVVLILNGIFKPSVVPTNIMVLYVGIASFLLLVWLGSILKWGSLRNIVKEIGKYSYPCFLVHHFVIYQIAGHFDLDTISVKESYALFGCVVVAVMFFSWALQTFYNYLKRLVHEKNSFI